MINMTFNFECGFPKNYVKYQFLFTKIFKVSPVLHTDYCCCIGEVICRFRTKTNFTNVALESPYLHTEGRLLVASSLILTFDCPHWGFLQGTPAIRLAWHSQPMKEQKVLSLDALLALQRK